MSRLKKLDGVCESGCGENSNESTCFIKDKEVSE